MKKTLLLTLMCMALALPAIAQYGYPYGGRPRVQTVGRHGNEYIAWHRYYFGLRVGMNVSHVNSESPLLDGSSPKTGLNIGLAAGTQLTYRAPLFLETGLYYTQKGGKSGSGQTTISTALTADSKSDVEWDTICSIWMPATTSAWQTSDRTTLTTPMAGASR